MIRIVEKLILLVVLFTAFSCEIDDVCTEEVLTPKLIIRFYDALEPSDTKGVYHIYVWAEGKDSLYTGTTKDSIVLPLNTLATQTKYLLSTSSVVDTLYLTHINNEVFVSRPCGYKFNFELQGTTHTSNQWISSFETIETPQIIDNEQAAHIKIFH